MLKKATVLLKDYINAGKDGLNEKVELIWDDAVSTKEKAAMEYIRNSYHEPSTGKTWKETGAKNGKHYKFIFSDQTDYFICWSYRPKNYKPLHQ